MRRTRSAAQQGRGGVTDLFITHQPLALTQTTKPSLYSIRVNGGASNGDAPRWAVWRICASAFGPSATGKSLPSILLTPQCQLGERITLGDLIRIEHCSMAAGGKIWRVSIDIAGWVTADVIGWTCAEIAGEPADRGASIALTNRLCYSSVPMIAIDVPSVRTVRRAIRIREEVPISANLTATDQQAFCTTYF
jgi:hypothetical protein